MHYHHTHDDEYHFCSPAPPNAAVLEVQLYRDTELQNPNDVEVFEALVQYAPPLLKAIHECIITFRLFTLHGICFPPEAQPWLLEWILCDDAGIRHLNQVHRDKDEPTDVLSFPLYESTANTTIANIPDFSKRLGGSLGSVVVSLEYATRHSTRHQHLAFILERFIHGTLHVLGQHHDDEVAFQQVLELQRFVLHKLNLESTLPCYDDFKRR